MVEYSENTNEEEKYCIFDLTYASVNDLIWLIEECDFSAHKLTLEELKYENPDYKDYVGDEAEEALGIYVLRDNQEANYGSIESSVFLQTEPTESDLKETLLAMIDRLEIYWEDQLIRFC